MAQKFVRKLMQLFNNMNKNNVSGTYQSVNQLIFGRQARNAVPVSHFYTSNEKTKEELWKGLLEVL